MNQLENHVMCLLKSFHHWTGDELLPMNHPPEVLTKLLGEAPFVVLSHGLEIDPILNYGNQKALELWEMTWDQFTKIPSRLTAEPINQEERDRLLNRVTRDGFIDDYSGVRMSSTGKRFFIEKAIVWNLLDPNNHYCGQAATFSQWKFI